MKLLLLSLLILSIGIPGILSANASAQTPYVWSEVCSFFYTEIYDSFYADRLCPKKPHVEQDCYHKFVYCEKNGWTVGPYDHDWENIKFHLECMSDGDFIQYDACNVVVSDNIKNKDKQFSEYKCIEIDAKGSFCHTSVKPAPPNCIWIDKSNRLCSDYKP